MRSSRVSDVDFRFDATSSENNIAKLATENDSQRRKNISLKIPENPLPASPPPFPASPSLPTPQSRFPTSADSSSFSLIVPQCFTNSLNSSPSFDAATLSPVVRPSYSHCRSPIHSPISDPPFPPTIHAPISPRFIIKSSSSSLSSSSSPVFPIPPPPPPLHFQTPRQSSTLTSASDAPSPLLSQTPRRASTLTSASNASSSPLHSQTPRPSSTLTSTSNVTSSPLHSQTPRRSSTLTSASNASSSPLHSQTPRRPSAPTSASNAFSSPLCPQPTQHSSTFQTASTAQISQPHPRLSSNLPSNEGKEEKIEKMANEPDQNYFIHRTASTDR